MERNTDESQEGRIISLKRGQNWTGHRWEKGNNQSLMIFGIVTTWTSWRLVEVYFVFVFCIIVFYVLKDFLCFLFEIVYVFFLFYQSYCLILRFSIFVFANLTSPWCILYMSNVQTIIAGTQAEIGLQLRTRREICFQGLFIYFVNLILRNQW